MKQLTRQLALFKQTVSTDTRSLPLLIIRLVFAAVLGLFIYMTQDQANRWNKIDGLYMFNVLTFINIIFIIFSALFLFMSLVKEEKEENTLDLILMTGISPFSFLTGKTGSRIVFLLIMLLVQVPFTYLCITMGALSIDKVILVYIILFFQIFQIAAISILISQFTTTLISGAITLLSSYFIINSIFMEIHRPKFLINKMFPPFAEVQGILQSTATVSLIDILPLLSWYLITGCIFFICALLTFNALLQPQIEISLPGKNKKGRKMNLLNTIFGMKRIKRLPVIYKGFKYNLNGTWLYLFQFAWISFFLWIAFDSYYGMGWSLRSIRNNFDDFVWDLAPHALLLAFIVFIGCGCRIFSSEIKNQTLGSLLMLPQSTKALYWQKLGSVCRCALPALICLAIVYFFGVKSSRQFRELNMILYILISCFFITTTVSLFVKKFTFFISAGAAGGFFLILVLISDFARFSNREMQAVCLVSALIITPLCIFTSIRKLKTYD